MVGRLYAELRLSESGTELALSFGPRFKGGIVDIWNGVEEAVGPYLPRVVGAIAILLIGWIVASIVSGLVRRLLHRTNIDNRLASAVDDEGAVSIESTISRGTFYLIVVLSWVAALEALGLTTVTQPLNEGLDQIFTFVPRVISAGVLLVLAWVIARIVRTLLSTTLASARLDQRVAGETSTSGTSLTSSLSEVGYWLVFLLFLPAILGALAVEGLLEPVQNMVDTFLGFLPNIVAAGIILAVGWFAATLVRRIATNLLTALGTNRFAERAGFNTGGGMTLSELIGLVAYALIFIPVIVGALNALQLEAVATPTSNMLDRFLTAVPNVFAAALVIGIAYFVGRIVADLVSSILAGAGFDGVTARLGLSEQPPVAPSRLAGTLVLTAILIFATLEAADLLGFARLAELTQEFAIFSGQVIFGVVVIAVGLLVANFIAGLVRASGTNQAELLANVARGGIIVLAAAMGLRQMGIANEIIVLAFGLPLAALSVAVAVALGVSLGIGGRDVAAQELESLRSSIRGGSQ